MPFRRSHLSSQDSEAGHGCQTSRLHIRSASRVPGAPRTLPIAKQLAQPKGSASIREGQGYQQDGISLRRRPYRSRHAFPGPLSAGLQVTPFLQAMKNWVHDRRRAGAAHEDQHYQVVAFDFKWRRVSELFGVCFGIIWRTTRQFVPITRLSRAASTTSIETW